MQPKYFGWNRFLNQDGFYTYMYSNCPIPKPTKKTKSVSQNTSVDFENLGTEMKTNQSHISCSGDGFSLK